MFRLLCTLVPAIIFCLSLSGNADAQWTQQASGVNDNLYGVHLISPQTGFAVGWGSSSGAQVLRTLNGGESWTHSILSYGAFVFSVTFTDDQHGYAAGCLNGGQAGAVFKTANGGDSWTYSSMSATYGLYDVEFATPELGFACGWLGKIYRTTNGGASWSSVSSGTGNVLRWMSIPTETTGYIVGGTNWDNPNRLYRSTNGGNSWSSVHTFSGAVIGGVHFFNDSCGVVSGGGGGSFIRKTTDSGDSWDTVYSGSGMFQFISFDDSGIGYACGNSGRVVRSEDYGDSWEELDTVTPLTTLLGVSGIEDAVCTVGTSGRIFRDQSGESVGQQGADGWPGDFRLGQNFPNPFNPVTTIEFELPVAQKATLTVYNLQGEVVGTPITDYYQAGSHQMMFDGSSLTSGLYIYRLTADASTVSRKMMLIR